MASVRADEAPPGLIAAVYRNLHHPGVIWSVRDRTTGLVVARTSTVILGDVEFRVQTGGQARARCERRRNVHAYAAGTVLADVDETAGEWGHATYDPFVHDFFADTTTGDEVCRARFAVFDHRGLSYCI